MIKIKNIMIKVKDLHRLKGKSIPENGIENKIQITYN